MFNLIFTCLACAGLAFGANNIDKVQYQSNDNVVFHQELKRNATYNDESYTITLTADELNNYVFENLYDAIMLGAPNEERYISDIYYNDVQYYIEGYTFDATADEQLYFSGLEAGDENSYVYIMYNGLPSSLVPNDNSYKWQLHQLQPTNTYLDFEYDVDIVCPSAYYSTIKTAIHADILANQPANDDYIGALGDFVSIMVSGLQSFGAGVANGVADFASALFLATGSGGNVTGLSIFGGIIAIFAGLALAVGITTRVYLWVTSLGK